MSKIEIYPSGNEYRWRIVTNGKIVGASSEGFYDKRYCIENAKKVMNGLLDYFNSEKSPILKPKILIPNKKKINLFDFGKYN